jgi:hypothetical protein
MHCRLWYRFQERLQSRHFFEQSTCEWSAVYSEGVYVYTMNYNFDTEHFVSKVQASPAIWHSISASHRDFFFMARQPQWTLGLVTVEVSRSYSDKPRSVGLLWTSDRPVAETSTWQYTTLTRETYMPPAEFEPAIPASERQQTHTLDRTATSYSAKVEKQCH